MPLTLAEANKIVEVAVAKAKELKLPMAVAVCDAEGRLMAFNRIGGTFWITAFAAQGKAAAATAFGRSSADLQDIGSSAAFQALSAQEGNHMVPVQGRSRYSKTGKSSELPERAEVRLRRTRTACGRASRPSACSFLL